MRVLRDTSVLVAACVTQPRRYLLTESVVGYRLAAPTPDGLTGRRPG